VSDTAQGRVGTTAAPPPLRGSRIAAIDVARGLAILGMFAAHTLTRDLDYDTIADGRSSILFATLAGVSLGLMTGGARPLSTGRSAARLGIGVRALLLILLGVLLDVPRTDIAVILDYYGIGFLLLLPLLFAPRLVLALAAFLAATLGPLVANLLDDDFDEPVIDLLADYLFTGDYPAAIWLAYLAVGLICARSGLTKLRTQIAMIGGGAAGMLAGYGAAIVLPGVTANAHTDSTAEVVGSGGFAVALIGLLLLVMSPLLGKVGGGIRAVFSPISAVGSMPLTIYTAQLIVLAVYIEVQPEAFDIEYPLSLFLAMSIAAIVFAVLWRRFLGAGPLERFMKRASGWPPERPRRVTD
jgi:uncharacterized membrane protein YeiB